MNEVDPGAQVPDFYIENQPGAPFRSELNTIIAALVSSNAGTEEPANPQAGMFWLDTSKSPWTLYRRNSDNTGWLQHYDAQNKPSKADVGLGNVPNYSATGSLTDGAENKFSTAQATKALNDNKLEKNDTATDSSKLGGVVAGSYALQTEDYPGLRARATTKGDVGLGNVPNYEISDSTSSNNSSSFASSRAVYDLNQAKLGKNEQAADSAKLGGKAPSSYANSIHSHDAGDLPVGSTSQTGLVQLNDGTGSSSTDQAATANAIRKAKAEALGGAVPPGIITMFAGTETQVPDNWQLCNGEGETSNGIKVPDLRDRFIVASGITHDPDDKGGATSETTSSAGNHSHAITEEPAGGHNHTITVSDHTLSTQQMPRHDHDFSHTVTEYGGKGSGGNNWVKTNRGVHLKIEEKGGGNAHDHKASCNSSGSHTHDVLCQSTGAHAHTVATLPPYYALAFIIKL